MKIGICNNENSYTKRYGDKAYIKLRELGFDAVDFNSLADTEGIYYTLPKSESDAMLLLHKKLSGDAGITISQAHGPWRWPPRDNFPTLGNADWHDFGKALADIGYNGVFSLEVTPPENISDKLYEEMSVMLRDISREIIGYGNA